jgi:hypothetical protein
MTALMCAILNSDLVPTPIRVLHPPHSLYKVTILKLSFHSHPSVHKLD